MEGQSNSISSQVQITFPTLERLLPHQRKVLLHQPERFKVLVWHRRARKTTTAITQITKWTQLKTAVYWHVFPTRIEAKDAIWRDPTMLFNIIPEELIEKKNEQELVVYFKNGSVYQLKGADDPDSLRGAGPFGVVLDEFADMKFYAWQVVEPILRANGGWCWFVGTPKGKNHLYQLYQYSKTNDLEWYSNLLKASESGIIPADQLEASKRTSTQSIWNQEYECEFLEGEGAVFRNVRSICTAVPQKPIDNHIYVIGADLAKVQDYTVLSVFDRTTNHQVYQDRFQTLEWPFQKAKIQAIAKHYLNALVVLDATGIGDPIADDLLRAGVAVEPFKITEQSKKDLIEKLSIWIEQQKIRLLPQDQTLFEYDNFTYEIGATGKIRYGARQGFHDDIVLSHALAVSGLQPIFGVVKQREKTTIEQMYDNAIGRGFKDETEEWSEYEAV